jgi:transposase
VVVQTPALARLIEGGIPTEALMANVMVSRFADHQPLYRQAQIMARQGVLINRATLAFWVGYGAAEIAPVVRLLKEIMLSSARIFADETTMRVLDPGRGGQSRAILGWLHGTIGHVGFRFPGGGLSICNRPGSAPC